MNKALERAISTASRLPDDEQETIACLMLEEMEAERGWKERFARSGDKLAELARQARAQHAKGETTEPRCSIYDVMSTKDLKELRRKHHPFQTDSHE